MHHKIQLAGDIAISTPTDSFNIIYLLLHSFRHFTGEGLGLRQFINNELYRILQYG
jgi:hypothetical protein